MRAWEPQFGTNRRGLLTRQTRTNPPLCCAKAKAVARNNVNTTYGRSQTLHRPQVPGYGPGLPSHSRPRQIPGRQPPSDFPRMKNRGNPPTISRALAATQQQFSGLPVQPTTFPASSLIPRVEISMPLPAVPLYSAARDLAPNCGRPQVLCTIARRAGDLVSRLEDVNPSGESASLAATTAATPWTMANIEMELDEHPNNRHAPTLRQVRERARERINKNLLRCRLDEHSNSNDPPTLRWARDRTRERIDDESPHCTRDAKRNDLTHTHEELDREPHTPHAATADEGRLHTAKLKVEDRAIDSLTGRLHDLERGHGSYHRKLPHRRARPFSQSQSLDSFIDAVISATSATGAPSETPYSFPNTCVDLSSSSRFPYAAISNELPLNAAAFQPPDLCLNTTVPDPDYVSNDGILHALQDLDVTKIASVLKTLGEAAADANVPTAAPTIEDTRIDAHVEFSSHLPVLPYAPDRPLISAPGSAALDADGRVDSTAHPHLIRAIGGFILIADTRAMLGPWRYNEMTHVDNKRTDIYSIHTLKLKTSYSCYFSSNQRCTKIPLCRNHLPITVLNYRRAHVRGHVDRRACRSPIISSGPALCTGSVSRFGARLRRPRRTFPALSHGPDRPCISAPGPAISHDDGGIDFATRPRLERTREDFEGTRHKLEAADDEVFRIRDKYDDFKRDTDTTIEGLQSQVDVSRNQALRRRKVP